MFIFGNNIFHDLVAIITLLFVSLALALISKKISERMKLIDYPDNSGLKIQKKPTPLAGGFVLIGSFLVTLSLYYHFSQRDLFYLSATFVVLVFVMIAGIFDDLHRLKAKSRLILYLIFSGIFLYIFHDLIFINVLFLAINIFLFAPGVITAINMIDGMDGLCSGLSIISMLTFLFVGLSAGNSILVALSIAGLVGLVTFLVFNFYPAKMFLGSSGSELIGFLFFILIILSMQNTPYYYIPLRILLVGIPIIDMIRVMIIRYKNGKPIIHGDRNHIYDILLAKGFNQKKVWVIMIFGQLAFVSLVYLLTLALAV